MDTNWHVITGGPSSGKTTVIECLDSLGYHTVAETARVLIDAELDKGKTMEEIRSDDAVFQKKILAMKVENENKTPPEQFTFFDRGIPDSIPYYQFAKLDISAISQLSQKKRYKRVFFLDQVPFHKDYARVENQKQADILSQSLYDAYTNLNYAVIRVPLMSVEKRTEFILSQVKNE